ncbi:MAG: nuclear transport factor 2 family protein [Saprospiraceae bacterium]
MKKIILLALLLPALHAAMGQTPRCIQTIRAFEQARYQALIKRDFQALDAMIAPELVYTHSNGNVEDRQAYVAALEKRTYVFSKFETDSTLYRSLNRRTVAATGIVRIAGAYQDKPFDIRGRFTALYICRKNQWQLHTWQTTKL